MVRLSSRRYECKNFGDFRGVSGKEIVISSFLRFEIKMDQVLRWCPLSM